MLIALAIAVIRLATSDTPEGIARSNQIAAALRAQTRLAEAVALVRCEPGASRLREAVLAGDADAAVHAADELPCLEHDRLEVIAFPPRGDPREALCAKGGARSRDLARGASVGAAGPRRLRQLAELRPDLQVVVLEAGPEAALARVGRDVDAVVLSCASLVQLGLLKHLSDVFALDQLVPAAGQAALAIEARRDDRAVIRLLAGLDDADSRLRVLAERAVLRRLQAWPVSQVGVVASLQYGSVIIRGVLAEGKGPLVRAQRSGPAGSVEQVADAVASALLLHAETADSDSAWP